MPPTAIDSVQIPEIEFDNEWIEEDYDILANVLFEENLGLSFSIETQSPPEKPPVIVSACSDSENEDAESGLNANRQEDHLRVTAISESSAIPSNKRECLETAKNLKKKRRVTKKVSVKPSQNSTITTPCSPTQSETVPVVQRASPKKETPLEKFLHAAAIAAEEETCTRKRPTEELTLKEEMAFRRERNRVMAKQTRERKKIHLLSLREEFQELHRENVKLRGIIKKRLPRPDVLLQKFTSRSDIPDTVWEAYGSDLAKREEKVQEAMPANPFQFSSTAGSLETIATEEHMSLVSSPPVVTSTGIPNPLAFMEQGRSEGSLFGKPASTFST